MSNTPHALKEIDKDIALLLAKGNDVKAIEWRFYPNLAGKVGPSAAVRELLQQHGIRYVMYVPAA